MKGCLRLQTLVWALEKNMRERQLTQGEALWINRKSPLHGETIQMKPEKNMLTRHLISHSRNKFCKKVF